MKVYEGLGWGWVVVWMDTCGQVHTKKFDTKDQATGFITEKTKKGLT